MIKKQDAAPQNEENEQRIVAASENIEDRDTENGLRPKQMSEYVGQEKAKKILGICIGASKLRGEAMDHVLLYGHTGLGKTTLA